MLEHFEDRPERAPSPQWWLIGATIQPVLQSISYVFKALEKKELVISLQKAELENLVRCIVDMVQIRDLDEDAILFRT